MGVKSNFDPAALVAAINQIGERAVRGVSRVMEEEGEKMRDLARSNAPRQEDHNGAHLEDAIKVESARTGIKGRVQVFVYVDGDMMGKNGHRIDDYAVMMEEGLAPYGSGAFNLGPESRAKAAGGDDVGGKYMHRAFRDRVLVVWKRADALVKGMLR